MKIYDHEGQEKGELWLKAQFGPIEINRSSSPAAFRVVELREVIGPSALTVTLRGRSAGQVAFFWPDAPEVESSEWFDRALVGDVNQDGTINVLDVLATINIILNIIQPSPEQKWAADCNGDGTVNVLDALGIVNVVLGIGTCP